MGFKATTIDRKFYNIFQNGDTLTGSPLDFNTSLVSYADERVKAVTTIDCETLTIVNISNPGTLIETPAASGNWVFTLTGGSWRSEGFAVGDEIRIDQTIIILGVPNTTFGEGDITVVDEERLVFTLNTGVLADVSEDSLQDEYEMVTHDLEPLTALRYSYGLNSNDEEYNNVNKVTGADQTFYTGGIGLGSPRSGAIQAMIPVGASINNDWHSNVNGLGEICEVRLVSVSLDEFIQRFEVTHVFRVNPSYVDGQVTNLQTKTAPDLFAGDASLKYAVQYEFRNNLLDVNSSKFDIDDNNLGSVGWREENFNGFDSNFSFESVVYTDDGTGLPADGVLRSGITKAVLRVRKLNGVWVSGDRVGVIIKKLSTQDEYTDTITTFDQNFILDDIFHTYTAPIKTNPAGSVLISLNTAIDGGDPNVLEYTALINYNASQQAVIDEDTLYELTAIAGTGAVTNLTSDRVALIADVSTYDLTNDIPGLVVPVTQLFYDEPLPVSTGLGYTSFEGWNYDNLAAVNVFDIDLSKGAIINKINMVWIAFDPIENVYWEIQNYAIQYLETQVGAIQELTLDSNRGFHLEDDSDFNNVKVTTGALVGDLQRYTVQVPFNVDWRDWQPDLNTDTVFYDNSKLNNNLNKKSSNYSNLNGYELRFALFFDMSGTSPLTGELGQTDYLMLSPNNTILAEDLPVDFTATVETFTEDGLTNLDGAIKDSGNTLLKTTYTQVSGPFIDLSNYWATNKIEDVGQLGNDVDKLSTENVHPSNNKLIPLVGEPLLKKELVGDDIVTSCFINGDLIDTGQNLVGRLGTKDNVPSVLPDGKLTTDDTPKEDTSANLKEQAP